MIETINAILNGTDSRGVADVEAALIDDTSAGAPWVNKA